MSRQIFEADINSHIEYIDPAEKFEYNINFMKEYVEIQNNFFGTIVNIGLRKDEIINRFYNYAINVENGKSEKDTNCDLNWLSEDKKAYFFTRQVYLRKSIKSNIRNAYDKIRNTFE